jgi:UDP-N-acetylmuramate dehydrogenase
MTHSSARVSESAVSAPQWLEGLGGVMRQEPLARHSQFGVGGPAQWFLKTADVTQLRALMQRCHVEGVPVTMLGAGSNALILDAGISGLVVRFDDRHLRVIDDTTVELGGGSMLPRIALDCARKGIAGLEFGIGVPGTCGASLVGNAGAFGTEMRDVLLDCTVITRDGSTFTLANAQCDFAYRDSRFKGALSGSAVVSARLRVRRDDPAEVKRRTLGIQTQRKATQPYGVRSLGSVFKNPPGDKAGRLLEAAGLKGHRVGGAEISAKHANFIVNIANATARDVLQLSEIAHDVVLQRFGVDLEREIVVLGDAEPATISAR